MTKKSISKLPQQIANELTPELILKRLHSFEGRVAEFLSDFSGSMPFVYFHALWFTLWVLINHGVFKAFIQPFDPFPYGLLTMVVSLEAIFLATFVLINQNRQALVDEFRELEEEKEQEEEEREQEELEEEVEDIQQDLDDIKSAMQFIQEKISSIEKFPAPQNGNGDEKK
ncbi:MAG: DUF1003 domain-containing protein [Patescibacteria group bacterium]